MRKDLQMHTGQHIDRNESSDLISAARVKGTDVYDASGDRIGEIDDVMITKRSGEIAYALMSFGGFLGIGEKYHPLPWDVLEYDTGLGGYRVGAAGENFRNAPAYSRDEMSGEDWFSSTDSYYSDSERGGGWLTRRDDRARSGLSQGRTSDMGGRTTAGVGAGATSGTSGVGGATGSAGTGGMTGTSGTGQADGDRVGAGQVDNDWGRRDV
jgi:sporulation protein YlmC with PRC-barrel domain